MLKISQKTFGLYIRKIREEKNISRTELAEKLNVTVSAVTKWENGERYPDFETIDSLANALDISVQDIYDNSKKEEGENSAVAPIITAILFLFAILGSCFVVYRHNINEDKNIIGIPGGNEESSTEETTEYVVETEAETILVQDILTKETTAPIITKHTEEYLGYSLGCEATHKLLDKKLEISFKGETSSNPEGFDVGVMLFANGIPQVLEYKKEKDYFATVKVLYKKEQNGTFYWDNYEDGDERIALRYASMTLPGLIVTDDPCFIPVAEQSLADGNPQILENKRLKQIEDIKDLEGEIDYSGEYFIGFEGFAWKTVYNREGLEKFVIKATRDENQCGNYILSFWGDGKPIQVGESMYYRVNLPAGEFKKFVFDMDAEQLKSITNFYYILAPEDDSKLKTIEKGDTIIFSDKVTNTVLE